MSVSVQRLAYRDGAFERSGAVWGRFNWVGPIVFIVELFAIVGLSPLVSALYHQSIFGTAGDLQIDLALGGMAFIYFAAIAAYRGDYSAANLHFGWRQVREITFIWGLVCFF